MALALVVHGGAGKIAAERHQAAIVGCQEAAVAGWQVLTSGGSALDAVTAAVTTLEDNPGFNAGTGSVLTSDGRAQCDAGIMEGEGLHAGAVAGVERIKNPIQLARLVLASPHVFLIGAGAEEFAVHEGISLCVQEDLITAAQRARWRSGYRLDEDIGVDPHEVEEAAEERPVHTDGAEHGTVGAVAVDTTGVVVAGTSTGGIAAKHPGRVGDTPVLGAGFYAENPYGGASSTGHGEHFIRLLIARRAIEFLAQGMPAQQAAEAAIGVLGARTTGTGGLIVLSAGTGEIGVAHNSPAIAWAAMREGDLSPRGGIVAP